MIKCKDCGASQYPGTLFCSECGRFLLDGSDKTTGVLPFSEFARRPLPSPVEEEGQAADVESKQLMFIIPASRRRVKVELADKIQIGRGVPDSDVVPELDLTDDNGVDNGVSREHAVIQLWQRGIVLIDLESTNGTLLNNSRLSPNLPYLLQSGDEVRFGDLLVHIFFL